MAGSGTRKVAGCPDTACGRPWFTAEPLRSRTRIDERAGSGCSVKVITTSPGARWRVAPAAGWDETKRAWASTRVGTHKMAPARTTAIATTSRFTDVGGPP